MQFLADALSDRSAVVLMPSNGNKRYQLMTTIELDIEREEAERLVRVALARTAGIVGYAKEGDTYVLEFQGGFSNMGQRVTVTFVERSPGQTRLLVDASRTSPLAMTANPWKYKSRLLTQIREVRDEGIDDIPDEAVVDPMVQEAVSNGEESRVEPTQTLRAVRRLLVLLIVFIVLSLILLKLWSM